MFSITTMASSTTSPVARVMPNRVSVLTENPSSLTKAKVPISETGMVTAGMMVLRQSCEKNKDDEDDQDNGLDQRGEHVPDRFAYRLGGVERILILHAGREMLGKTVQFGQDQAVHFESVRGRELGNAETYRVVTVVHQV